jgi:HPt (histidine-containing phosphotransfer) domain-containing protein
LKQPNTNLASHVDPAVKQSLLELGDPTLFDKLIEIFIESSEKYLEQLEKEFAKNNEKQIHLIAHTWKASANGIGALSLGSLCKELELNPQKKELLPLLAAEYRIVRKELLESK